ncbi:cutinase family protein [Nocardia brasiliensis]|uniref:cutinase family protein n=1 Tax=Nocardia brasiliensis TaxID=37326 RepID=UPI00245550DA|nr:cutinase family protein [Nocardia brasiliensis]
MIDIRQTRLGSMSALLAAFTIFGGGVVFAQPTVTGPVPRQDDQIPCTALHVVGFHGSGQTGDASITTLDSGFLGSAVTNPLLDMAEGAVSRQLRPYAADFSDGGNYAHSMSMAVKDGLRAIGDYAQRCPGSSFALVGQDQGAQVADELARLIGTGDASSPILAERVAGVSLFSSPIRPLGAGVFAGADTRRSPAVPAGVSESAVSRLVLADPAPAPGAGIASPVGSTSGYGSLTGRVASWCAGGDVGCSTPADAPLARTVANLARRADFSGADPLRTVADIATALGGSVLRTAASVINDDVGFSGGHFTIGTPGKTIVGRLAENADPSTATPAADEDIVRALIKVGVMGFQAAVSVASKVLTPGNIAELVAVGMANPVAALADLGTKIAGATLDLFPPASINSGVRYIFNEISRDVVDNAGLARMALDLRYWDSGRQHLTYDSAPVGVDGQSAAAFTVEWFAAMAKELQLSGHSHASASGAASTSSTPAPGR